MKPNPNSTCSPTLYLRCMFTYEHANSSKKSLVVKCKTRLPSIVFFQEPRRRRRGRQHNYGMTISWMGRINLPLVIESWVYPRENEVHVLKLQFNSVKSFSLAGASKCNQAPLIVRTYLISK